MNKDDSDRWGSMSDLWVIFELPAEDECKEDYEDDLDDDIVSVLGQSMSDSFSVESSSLTEYLRQNVKNPTKVHPCKRIDRNSFRSLGGSTKESSFRSLGSSTKESSFRSLGSSMYLSDDIDLTEHSNDEDCSTVDSSVVYFSGDRWSPCVSPKKKVHSISVAAFPSLDQEESPLSVKKLDQSPRVPRRKPAISTKDGNELTDSLPRLPLRNRAS